MKLLILLTSVLLVKSMTLDEINSKIRVTESRLRAV
jgi:hypothetical protein